MDPSLSNVLSKASSSLDPNFGKMELEKELTNKFLSGEMSFAEYSSEWYSNDEDDLENEDDNEEENRSEFETQHTFQMVKKGSNRGRKYTRLSAALLGLMGEANLRFVRGDRDMAEKMCYEIIKQVPTAPEPYQTLAQIYESDPEKSLQFSLLAAHLSPSDANEWLRLAAVSKQRNDYRQEIMCYTQAIRADSQNLDNHLKRLEVLNMVEEAKCSPNAFNVTRVKCYHKIVVSMPATEGETIMKYARLAVKLYSSSQETERASEVLSVAYKKCSNLFTSEDINIFLDVLITNKQYQTCIEIFVENQGVEIEAEILTVQNSDGLLEEQTHYLNCHIPNDLLIDLKTKLLICFIYLNAFGLVQTLINEFLKNDVEKAGDLYMDIEEALSAVGQHELALKMLIPLIKSKSFNLGAVWLKHAECLDKLGREDEAIKSYYKVLECVPQHANARKKLYTILNKKGCIDDALDILQQDYKFVVSASIMYEQCCELKKHGKMLKYLEVGEALLSKTFIKFRHPEELKLARLVKRDVDCVYKFRTMHGENPYSEDDIHFDEDENFSLSTQQEWELFVDLLTVALKHKKYCTMQRLTYGALMSRGIALHRKQIEFYCLQACYLNNDYENAIIFLRDLCQKYPTPRVWNLLNIVYNVVGEVRHGKFLLRFFQKETNDVVRFLFRGNNFLTSGRYIIALKNYLHYHELCRDSLSALLIGITILVLAGLRTVDKHHNLVLQGITYLMNYKNLRKCDQETYFNIGRAYHMLSIKNLAIEYYEKALACDPITVCDKHGVIDLTRETAYNLYLLYKDHAPNIARNYLLKYIVV